ncbi:hypothetical protein F5884DRAFT_777905 [Xylogone sp. PMI_703]|nr:hypothetical protein F5884DRAFT_777905 [Xylogone sp. PMI_703]
MIKHMLIKRQLESKLEAQEDEHTKSQRSVRNVDRTVKDLQQQIDRRDKQNAQLQEDLTRSRDKIEKLLKTIDELQSSDSTNQLSARRAERELREEHEKALRLERELETYRRGIRPNEWSEEDEAVNVPQRKSSLNRQASMTKGFL